MNDGLDGTYQEIEIGRLVASPWNPNEMTDAQFAALVSGISRSGMIAPVQVVPHIDGEGDPCYRIIGGEHRWRAMKVLGYKSVPCVILDSKRPDGEDWSNEDFQKFETVRLNVVHGNTNPEKFMALYLEVADKHHGADLQDEFGFTDDDAWEALVGQVIEGSASALPKDAHKAVKDAVQKLTGKQKTVEALSKIVQGIIDEYGSTVEDRFVYFDLGGKKHLHISVRDKTFAMLESWIKENVVDGVDADKALRVLLSSV